MTVVLKDIPKMSSKEATLVLNNMMADFSKVRLQVSNTGDGAVELMIHNDEVIDMVVEMLFKRINNPSENIFIQINDLKEKATNTDVKVYHALSYNDGNVEANLKASIKDIADVNSKFVEFVKNKKNGEDENLKKAKTLFFDKSKEIKRKYDVTYEKDDHTIKLKKDIVIQKDKIDKLSLILDEEKNFIDDKKKGLLPQILTVIALATTTSKLVNFLRNINSKKEGK